MTLKSKTISGVRWTTFSTFIVATIQIVQLSILTRFLSPSDFGLMAIVMMVISFNQSLLDMGISNAIIHKQIMTNEQLSTLYWLNVISGIVLFIFTCALSPILSVLYNDPTITILIIILGTTFLIQPFGQQFMILLKKDMRFSEISKVDIAIKLLSLTVSVFFAYIGHGVYALIFGALAGVILQTMLYVYIGMKDYRPKMIFRWETTREFLNFGVYQIGERTINYFNSQIDVILIGKLLGTEALGVYNVAKQLIMRPAQIINPVITNVTFPAMALIQGDTKAIKRVYLNTISYLSSINFPIYILLILLAPEVVYLLFGNKWMLAVPTVQILSIYGALRSTGNPVGTLLLAKGMARWSFYWNLGLLLYFPIGVAYASRWGITGISWALTAISASLIIPTWYFLVRPLCGAGFKEYITQFINPVAISIAAGITCYLVSNLFSTVVLRLAVGFISGIILYFFLSLKFNREFISTNNFYYQNTRHAENYIYL